MPAPINPQPLRRSSPTQTNARDDPTRDEPFRTRFAPTPSDYPSLPRPPRATSRPVLLHTSPNLATIPTYPCLATIHTYPNRTGPTRATTLTNLCHSRSDEPHPALPDQSAETSQPESRPATPYLRDDPHQALPSPATLLSKPCQPQPSDEPFLAKPDPATIPSIPDPKLPCDEPTPVETSRATNQTPPPQVRPATTFLAHPSRATVLPMPNPSCRATLQASPFLAERLPEPSLPKPILATSPTDPVPTTTQVRPSPFLPRRLSLPQPPVPMRLTDPCQTRPVERLTLPYQALSLRATALATPDQPSLCDYPFQAYPSDIPPSPNLSQRQTTPRPTASVRPTCPRQTKSGLPTRLAFPVRFLPTPVQTRPY